MSVPNTFASATSAIPLANLDADFAYYDAAFQIVGTAMEVNYTFRLEDPTDTTKKAEFVMSGITTGTTRLYTMPNASGTLATLANTSQTFLGSTVFAPSTNSGTITIGGIPQTGAVTLGRSTASQTVDIAVGATTAVSTKTVNIGTNGVSGSTTNINLGSAVSGAVNNIVLNNSAAADGVVYLNSFKVLTTGTGLRFDGDTLGVGVYPSGWDTGSNKALQIAKSGAIYSNVSSNSISMSANLIIGTDPVYLYSDFASDYSQVSGKHIWSTAASGTAGNIITFTQAMTLTAAGNLGIGTTSPGAKLDVQGSAVDFVGISSVNTNSSNAALTSSAVRLGVTNTVRVVYSGIKTVEEGTDENKTSLVFSTTNASFVLTDYMRLDSSGNLGLGVTPSAWFSVYKAIQIGSSNPAAVWCGGYDLNVGANIFQDGSGTYKQIGATYKSALYKQFDSAHSWYITTNVGANTAVVPTQAMTLDASGNLGIGTPLPGVKLDVRGTSNTAASTIQIVGNTVSSLLLGQNADGGVIRGQGGNNALTFWTGGSGDTGAGQSGSEKMRLDTSGNLLVGTTVVPVGNRTNGHYFYADGGYNSRTVASKRDWGISVTSGAIVNFYSDNGSAAVYAGSIDVNGNVTSYTSVSDYRLKENVVPMSNALANVMALNPVTYTFKNGGQPSQGFIAHELQAVMPECVTGEKDAVKEDGSPAYQGVDTSFLVATLTAAIQEQQAMIEDLKTRLAVAGI